MSRMVLDASIALSWLLPDEASESTDAIQTDLINADETFVPTHWKLEVVNSLCMAERRQRLNAPGIAQAIALFSQIPVAVDSETNNHAAVETLALARQHSLSAYDAAYLELALRKGAPLASLDKQLRDAAKKSGVTLLPKKISPRAS